MGIYFEHELPVKDTVLQFPAERTRYLRLNRPEQVGGYQVPLGVTYVVRLRSDVPVVGRYSRLDTTQVQWAMMTTMAFPVE